MVEVVLLQVELQGPLEEDQETLLPIRLSPPVHIESTHTSIWSQLIVHLTRKRGLVIQAQHMLKTLLALTQRGFGSYLPVLERTIIQSLQRKMSFLLCFQMPRCLS